MANPISRLIASLVEFTVGALGCDVLPGVTAARGRYLR